MVNKNWIYKYFSEDELIDIQSAVDKVESKTIGEIVLSFRNKRNVLEKLYTPHEFAVKDFEKLGVTNTREKTGVMLFIIFGERYYDILADEGINAKISDKVWHNLEEKLKAEFQKENYTAGVLLVIKKMGEILHKEFPARADSNDDEISDEIVIN